MRDAHDADDIHVEDGGHVAGRVLLDRPDAAEDARVVDKDVDAPFVRGDVGGRGGDRVVVRHVDLHEPGTERRGRGPAALRVAGADQDAVSRIAEAAGSLETE